MAFWLYYKKRDYKKMDIRNKHFNLFLMSIGLLILVGCGHDNTKEDMSKEVKEAKHIDDNFISLGRDLVRECIVGYYFDLLYQKSAKKYVVDFYNKLLGKQDFDTLDIWESKKQVIVNQKDVLTQGYHLEEIKEIVDRGETFIEGELFDMIVHVSFPNDNDLYFQLTEGWSLHEIWLPDGSNLWTPSLLYKRPAIIRSDLLELVKIHEKPGKDSRVMGFLNRDELFFFTPVSGQEWVMVYHNEHSPAVGYIERSQITLYDDFPPRVKEIVKELRVGC